MRKLLIALTILSSTLSGCSAVPAIIGGITTITGNHGVQCQTSLTAARAYYGFEAGYNGVAQAISSIAGTAILPTGSPRALQIKGKYTSLIKARKDIEGLVDACNTGQLSSQAAAGMVLVADLQMLIGKAKANPGG